MITRYEPGASRGKRKWPDGSVTVFGTIAPFTSRAGFPLASTKDKTTPVSPRSSVPCRPFLALSSHTNPPTLTPTLDGARSLPFHTGVSLAPLPEPDPPVKFPG